jgi:hypothetical protein
MGRETSVLPSVSTNTMDDRPQLPRLGLPERMLQKIGFYYHPVLYVSISSPYYRKFRDSDPRNYRIMLCLLASPYVVFYPTCRQYCDAASCRYYRFNIFSALLLFFLFIVYRASERQEDTPIIPTTGTQQREGRADKV